MSLALDHLVIKKILGEEALAQYQSGNISHKILNPYASAIRELSAWYVGDRAQKQKEITAQQAQAYALYYLLVNATKWRWFIEYAQVKFESPLNVLDFGSGPGTASLVVPEYFSKASATLIESSQAMRNLASVLQPEAHVHRTLNEATSGPYQLICCSNVLNELSASQAWETVQALIERLDPRGTLMILEPALLDVTRAMMQLRNSILEHYSEMRVTFPCFRQDACPMLAEKNNWCHTAIQPELPRIVSQLDTILEFNKHRIKFCCFVFQKNAPVSSGRSLRIITETERTKRGFEALVCGEQQYGTYVLSKKQRTPETKAFEHAQAFDSWLPPAAERS